MSTYSNKRWPAPWSNLEIWLGLSDTRLVRGYLLASMQHSSMRSFPCCPLWDG